MLVGESSIPIRTAAHTTWKLEKTPLNAASGNIVKWKPKIT